MQSRDRSSAIYEDLLEHGISQKELDNFIYGFQVNQEVPAEELGEFDHIDKPIYTPCPIGFVTYQSGLCYAIASGNLKIAEALLNIGANPNIYNPYIDSSPALVMAALHRKDHPRIYKLLLTAPNIDIYVGKILSNKHIFTAFLYAKGDANFIYKLLLLDPALTTLKEESFLFQEASNEIAEASKSIIPETVNAATCNAVGKLYKRANKKHQLAIEDEKNLLCGRPMGRIVTSYLTFSFFVNKPDSLAMLEMNQPKQSLKK